MFGEAFFPYVLDSNFTKHILYARYFHLILMTQKEVDKTHLTDEVMCCGMCH